jgi:hypothetical protein
VIIAIAAGVYSAIATADVAAPPHRDAGVSGYPKECRGHGGRHQRRWNPAPTTTPWQWQLQGKPDVEVPACVYDLDGFETSRRTVRLLHRRQVKVICYLDVGSWESFRPDRKEFPRSVIGRRYEGFPNERWHLEYFHDHVRIERMLFDGTLDPIGGELEPDRSRPGLGLELKRDEAERWAV